MEIYTVESEKGFNCWSNTARYSPVGGVIYLSLFGSHNSVLSVWATLTMRGHDQVTIRGQRIFLAFDTHYQTIRCKMPNGGYHLILAHPDVTNQTKAEGGFHMVFDDPSTTQRMIEDRFVQILEKKTAIPLRHSWASYLWAKGLEKKYIISFEGFGSPAFHVYTMDKDEDLWVPIVQQGVISGELK